MHLYGRIAVIVPVYNRAITCLATLDSVVAQTELPSTLFVVDDGSTDEVDASLGRWLAGAQQAFPVLRAEPSLPGGPKLVQFIRQPHQGAAAARNRGIVAADDCDYFAFLDSDDTWPPDFLARCRGALDTRPEAVAVTADRLFVDAWTKRQTLDRQHDLAAGAARRFLQHDAGIASATLFRADPIRRLGGFDESIPTGHDSHLFLRLSLLGPWLHSPGQPVVFSRNHAARLGEHDHLHRAIPAHAEIWATIYEDFVERGGGRQVLPPRFCDDQLARRWYRAGRNWGHQGYWNRARHCYQHSLRYRFRPKTWLHMAWAQLHPSHGDMETVPSARVKGLRGEKE